MSDENEHDENIFKMDLRMVSLQTVEGNAGGVDDNSPDANGY